MPILYNITRTTTMASDDENDNIVLKILCIVVAVILAIFICIIISIFLNLVVVDYFFPDRSYRPYRPYRPMFYNSNIKKIETKENIYMYI